MQTQAPPRRVLIVEDDALTSRIYRSTLAPGFSCHCEPTGEGALAHLSRERADAVLLDWDLPGMSGLEVLKTIRAGDATGGLPVLMVTGRTDGASRALAAEHGATGYRNKPVEAGVLIDWLRQACAAGASSGRTGGRS